MRDDDRVAQMKAKGLELAAALRDALPETCAYMLVLKDGGSISFFTDATRAEAARTLREVVAEIAGPVGD